MVNIIYFNEKTNTIEIKISKILNNDFKFLLNDIVRMLLIQTTIQFMFFTKSPELNPFFTYAFFETLLYICIGLCIYWLIIKKLVKII